MQIVKLKIKIKIKKTQKTSNKVKNILSCSNICSKSAPLGHQRHVSRKRQVPRKKNSKKQGKSALWELTDAVWVAGPTIDHPV